PAVRGVGADTPGGGREPQAPRGPGGGAVGAAHLGPATGAPSARPLRGPRRRPGLRPRRRGRAAVALAVVPADVLPARPGAGAGLRGRLPAEGADPVGGGVRAPLLPAHPAARPGAHPPVRVAVQPRPRGTSGAMPCVAGDGAGTSGGAAVVAGWPPGAGMVAAG